MVRVFVNQLPFYVIKSTDIDYVQKLQSISNELNATFYYPSNILWGWKENLYAIINKLFSLLGLRFKIRYTYPKKYLSKAFEYNNFDVVYSQGIIPVDIEDTPVFLETTFWVPGQNSKATNDGEILFKEKTVPYMRQVLDRNCIVNLKSNCEIQNVLKYFPNSKNKIVSLPFLLPSLKPISKEDLCRKHTGDSTLRILFVGGQANRKGLPSLIKAFCQFKDKYKKSSIELHIVSGYTDGKIAIPKGYGIVEHGKLPHNETQKLFRQCHIFAMISTRESYGLVYIEAMANGCLVIARNFYPQREILNEGTLGLFAKPDDIKSIETAIENAYTLSQNERLDMTLRALEKFETTYSFNVVAPKYTKVFQDLADNKRNDGIS